jgi:hypothetical protein
MNDFKNLSFHLNYTKLFRLRLDETISDNYFNYFKTDLINRALACDDNFNSQPLKWFSLEDNKEANYLIEDNFIRYKFIYLNG